MHRRKVGRQPTALIAASSNSHEAVVKLLLSHNDVVVNTQDKEGRTAHFVASAHGHVTVVKLLLSHNSDMQLEARNGQTALVDEISWRILINFGEFFARSPRNFSL
jgi:ankyrin repeat protein